MRLQYPAIPRDDWKTTKIKSKEHHKIIYLVQSGHTIKSICEIYHVSYQTIRKIIDPDYKQKTLEKDRIHQAEKYQDEKWVKNKRKRNLELKLDRYHNDPKFKEWTSKYLQLRYNRGVSEK